MAYEYIPGISAAAPRGATVAARGLLADPRAPGNESAWTALVVKTKFSEEDRNSVQEAVAAARVASVTEPEEGSDPTWRPEGEFSPMMASNVINSRNALSGVRREGLRLSHLQSIISTQFRQELFGAGIEALWRRIVDQPDDFPPKFWELFPQ